MTAVTFSLETLEYDKLLELVSRNAQTPMGVERFAVCGRSRTAANLTML